MRNPFLSSAAGKDLDRNRADVAEINAEAFQACRRMVEDVRANGVTQALLLDGEPGSGKTHLLGRLQRHLEERFAAGEPSVFVAIRMATTPGMLWRLIREHLAEALLARRAGGRRVLPDVLRKPDEEIAETNRDLGQVIANLRTGVRVADSAAWLKGHDLPQPVLEALGIASAHEEDDLEAASQRVTEVLCRLIAPVPIVFCLDQLESIQSHAGETADFFQFGRIVCALHDSSNNLAIVSCLQTGLLNELSNGLSDQYKQRLERRRATLQPLNGQQVRRLAEVRLDTVDELREERRGQADKLWPLDAQRLEASFPPDGRGMVARKAIVVCSDLFEAWQRGGKPAPVATVSPEEFLETGFRERLRPTDPAESDHILRSGLPELFRLYRLPFEPSDPSRKKVLDGILRTNPPVAIAVCNQSTQGGALVRRFHQLAGEWPDDVNRLAVLRDTRKSVGSGAAKTQERWSELAARGARMVSADPEVLAALNALHELLVDARSGDVAIGGDSVPLGSVEAWLANHLPPKLQDLVDDLSAPVAAEPRGRDTARELFKQELSEVVNKARVVLLEEAARKLGLSEEEVEAVARRNPLLFGLAGGAKSVLYRIVPPAEAS